MRWIPTQAIPFVQALWRHRWLAVGTAWLVCTAGWIGIAFILTKYESTARVYLNADPLLTPLLRGLAADTDPGRHLDFMQRTLLSRGSTDEHRVVPRRISGDTADRDHRVEQRHVRTIW